MENKPSPKVIIAVFAGITLLGCLPFSVLFLGGVAWYFLMVPEPPSSDWGEATEPGDIIVPETNPLTPASSVQRDGSEPTLSGAMVEVEVVQFSDFQCQFCASRFDELLDLAQRSSWLQLQFKHYPLSDTCNPNVSVNMHEHACAAAKAAECAHEQDLFWPMAAEMFDHQDALTADDLMARAAAAGLRKGEYRRCMARDNTDGLLADMAAAAALGVQGTPSIYAKAAGSEQWYQLEGDLTTELELLRQR